jgi:hypothetical protein
MPASVDAPPSIGEPQTLIGSMNPPIEGCAQLSPAAQG